MQLQAGDGNEVGVEVGVGDGDGALMSVALIAKCLRLEKTFPQSALKTKRMRIYSKSIGNIFSFIFNTSLSPLFLSRKSETLQLQL